MTLFTRKHEEEIERAFPNRTGYDKNKYLKREAYEHAFERSLKRSRFLFVTGDSGNGKTWLTQHCIEELHEKHTTLNLSEAAMEESLLAFFQKKTSSETVSEREDLVGGEFGFDAGIKAGINTKYKEKSIITINALWPFIKKYKNQIVIFDNFESIISKPQLLHELGCLITLVDDPRIIDSGIKFVIIGTVKDFTHYFKSIPNYQTISNRISTQPIGGFTKDECTSYVTKGFKDARFNVANIAAVSERIFECAGGVPQSINDLCNYIAFEHFDAKKESIDTSNPEFYDGCNRWILERMKPEYELIYSFFIANVKQNKNLNFVLYAIAEHDNKPFSAQKIKASAEEAMLNETQSLNQKQVTEFLIKISDTSDNNNILNITNVDEYKIRSAKTKGCMQTLLDIRDDDVFIANLPET